MSNNIGDKVRAVEKHECGCVHTEYLGIIDGREQPYTVVEPCKAHKPKVEVIEFQIADLNLKP